jgi:hypothetical protein
MPTTLVVGMSSSPPILGTDFSPKKFKKYFLQALKSHRQRSNKATVTAAAKLKNKRLENHHARN